MTSQCPLQPNRPLLPLTPIQLHLPHCLSGYPVQSLSLGKTSSCLTNCPLVLEASPDVQWEGKPSEDRHVPPTGNSNLVYAIIRKRGVFHQLANLPTDPPSIHKALQRRRKTPEPLSRAGSQEGTSMEGSRPAAPAEPGTLKTSLVATPGLDDVRLGECGAWLGVHCEGVGVISGVSFLSRKPRKRNSAAYGGRSTEWA